MPIEYGVPSVLRGRLVEKTHHLLVIITETESDEVNLNNLFNKSHFLSILKDHAGGHGGARGEAASQMSNGENHFQPQHMLRRWFFDFIRGRGAVSICVWRGKLFQADAVQNQEMLQKAYEAANRVKVIFAKLEPLLCFGTNDNCPKTIFISLISSKAASFLAASLKIKKDSQYK